MRSIHYLLLAAFLTGCHSNEPKEVSTQEPAVVISASEKKLCDSMGIETGVIALLRKSTSSPLEHFHYSLSKQLMADGDDLELDPIFLKGLVFKESNTNTHRILDELQPEFKKKGYSIFILEQNFGIGNKPDVMAILKTTDKFEILRAIKTDGINYDINNDSLIRIIKFFDDKYALDLTAASGDWCEFKIMKEPSDWMAFAKDAYHYCPDIVDQGTGTVEALADELKRTGHLYFWWD